MLKFLPRMGKPGRPRGTEEGCEEEALIPKRRRKRRRMWGRKSGRKGRRVKGVCRKRGV